MEYPDEVIGRRLYSGIIDQGIDIETFAESLGVSQEVVKNWISGRTRIPLSTGAKCCDVLGWPLDRLAVRD